MTAHFPFDNTYARLPDRFFARIAPTPVSAPRLVRLNRALAMHLGLDPDWLESAEGIDILAGKRVPEGAEPIALAYAGHQFGSFVPQLGDGRAILLGELVDRDGVRRDIQLKPRLNRSICPASGTNAHRLSAAAAPLVSARPRTWAGPIAWARQLTWDRRL